MSPPIWILSVPLGYLNVLAPRFVALYFIARAGIEPDASNPRKQLAGDEVAEKDADGYISRAYNAHQNGWEAMSIWVAAVLLARVMAVDQDKMNVWAAVWLTSRILYNIAYIAIKDKTLANVRTLIFMVGTLSGFVLMWSAAQNS